MGRRGGGILLGVDRIRGALQAGAVKCLIVSADASPRAREKVVRLARARRVPMIAGPAAELLGARLGTQAVMVIGVLDQALARGLQGVAPRASFTED